MSLLTSYTRPGAVDAEPWVETCEEFVATAASAVSVSNDGVFYRIRDRRATGLIVNKIRVYVAVQNANVDVGVYSYDGTTWALLGSSGSTAVAAGTTVQTLTLTTAVPILPGLEYYLGLAADGTTATFGRTASNAAAILAAGPTGPRCVAKATSFPLATNAISFVAAGTKAPLTVVHWLRASAT